MAKPLRGHSHLLSLQTLLHSSFIVHHPSSSHRVTLHYFGHFWLLIVTYILTRLPSVYLMTVFWYIGLAVFCAVGCLCVLQNADNDCSDDDDASDDDIDDTMVSWFFYSNPNVTEEAQWLRWRTCTQWIHAGTHISHRWQQEGHLAIIAPMHL